MISYHLGEVVKDALQLVQTGHQPPLSSSNFDQLLAVRENSSLKLIKG